ncbi:MAG TPA: hypothetical protein VGE01_06560 [Fimbriimonas sp.]
MERLLYLFLGAAYLLVWIQLTLLHWRGAFHHRMMWGPVVVTPIVVLAAVALGLSRQDATATLFNAAFAIATVVGLIGTYYHLRGVASQVGGFTLRNAATGPPPVLPLIYSALGAFGLIVNAWPQIAGRVG